MKHPFNPIYDENSKALILGSFPSVKSREENFYYAHKQNRFWKVLGSLFYDGMSNYFSEYAEKCREIAAGRNVEEKKSFLLKNGIALWDVFSECEIIGSADSTIQNFAVNDFSEIIRNSKVGVIYCNGNKAYSELLKACKLKPEIVCGCKIVCLPSTSPANAAWSLDALISSWRRVKTYIDRTDFTSQYYSMSAYINDTYERKLYKLSLDGGFTCPNRDGSKGIGGCIFCDNEGSGHFTGRLSGAKSITEQLNSEKQLIASKLSGKTKDKVGYIAYFQSYTGTYDDVINLRKKYYEAIEDPEVRILSIATRPDCLGEDVLDLLSELCKIIPVWVELGLQTSNEKSAKLINRCYENKVYSDAVFKLRRAGVCHIITHVILGLPGEANNDMLASVRFVADSGVDGIKLQLLHVLKDTKLAQMYEDGEFECLSLEEYGEIVKSCVDLLPPDMVVHRITGDGDKNKLIAPLWSGDKKRVLNYINSILSKS